MAKPFFIVSSGRSGTAMLHKALSAKPTVSMHHEYAVEVTQPLAVQRYLGLADEAGTREILRQIYSLPIMDCKTVLWGDSSNKASWLISDLAALFPEARFVHLVRDGRKVASSYFHKLGDECYDDASNAMMQAHYDDPAQAPAPPPEKPYWWPVPRKGTPEAEQFRHWNQFQRIAWHWAEINRVTMAALAALPRDRSLFVRLEDLRTSPAEVRMVYEFLNLPFRDSDFALFARPHNVNRPQDRLLDSRQRRQFETIAGDMMRQLGYSGTQEYRVKY
jgi:hypothetical protein